MIYSKNLYYKPKLGSFRLLNRKLFLYNGDPNFHA